MSHEPHDHDLDPELADALAAQETAHTDSSTGHGHGHGQGHEHRGGVRGFLAETFRPHSHDSADSVDSALESSALGIRAVKISLLALGFTAIA